ncbi:thiamine phosphate synthase [Massilia sp. W12]|uniref:thiamine phosphate synthase n=1 Tax=Massilia sp. W12 TaxID=3126507 RepID=UPI0030CA9306
MNRFDAAALRGLYLVTPDWDDTAALLQASEAALQAGAALLQYRHKSAGPAQRLEQAGALQALCARYGKPFIINDYLDLALQLDADGLHVGGTDIAVRQARAALGPDKILGASCYGSLDLAQAAQEQGASYLAFGGFYPSRVKKYEVATQPDIINQALQRFTLPCVVIGGMTVENSAPLVARGAQMVAAISSVYMAQQPPGPAAAEFVRLFAAG